MLIKLRNRLLRHVVSCKEHRLLAQMNTVVIRSETQVLTRQLNDNVYIVDLVARPALAQFFKRIVFLAVMR